jgi:hypothetical protein
VFTVDMAGEPFGCECDLIARVRTDERRHAEMGAVIDREVITDEVREQVAQEIEVCSRQFAAGPYAMAVLVGARVARRTLP